MNESMPTTLRKLRLSGLAQSLDVRLQAEGDQGGSPKAATAILDRFLHHAAVITLTGKSYRLRNPGHQGKTGYVNTGKTKQGDSPCREQGKCGIRHTPLAGFHPPADM